ncbi:PH domain-containing protein [Chloroflexota bacterium]
MEKIYGIIPAASGPMIFIVAIVLVLILVIGLLSFIGYSSKNVRFEINDEGLKISRSIYGRLIPRDQIVASEVKVIDLSADLEYKPKHKTNGAGLPGYSEGWFKLNNNEKALLFVTDRSSVVYIPTNKNFSVLLSVKEAGEFARSIKSWD